MTQSNVCERYTLVDGVLSIAPGSGDREGRRGNVEPRFTANDLTPKVFVSAFDSV